MALRKFGCPAKGRLGKRRRQRLGDRLRLPRCADRGERRVVASAGPLQVFEQTAHRRERPGGRRRRLAVGPASGQPAAEIRRPQALQLGEIGRPAEMMGEKAEKAGNVGAVARQGMRAGAPLVG